MSAQLQLDFVRSQVNGLGRTAGGDSSEITDVVLGCS
jgi:hypothetical protein